MNIQEQQDSQDDLPEKGNATAPRTREALIPNVQRNAVRLLKARHSEWENVSDAALIELDYYMEDCGDAVERAQEDVR